VAADRSGGEHDLAADLTGRVLPASANPCALALVEVFPRGAGGTPIDGGLSMGIPISTMGIGLDQAQNVAQQYEPPNVVVVPGPAGPPAIEVEYGAGVGLSDGQSLPGTGVWLIVSGTLVASGSVQAYPVTITNGPTPP
jgi:hypothetical protein